MIKFVVWLYAKTLANRKILSYATVWFNSKHLCYECYSLIKRNFKSQISPYSTNSIHQYVHTCITSQILRKAISKKIFTCLHGVYAKYSLMYVDVIYICTLKSACNNAMQMLKFHLLRLFACESAIYFTHHVTYCQNARSLLCFCYYPRCSQSHMMMI